MTQMEKERMTRMRRGGETVSPGLYVFSSRSLSPGGVRGGVRGGERHSLLGLCTLPLLTPLTCWRTEPTNRTPPRALLFTCQKNPQGKQNVTATAD